MLPPGGLIVAALTGLLFWRRGWGRALIAFSLGSLWLLATEPVRDALISPLENRYAALDLHALTGSGAASDRRAIVLLGGGVYARAPEYQGRDALAADALMRTIYAADLARRTGLPVYATGGAVLSAGSEPEGSVMQRWLVRLGVSGSRIHSETAARNTWENAANLKERLQSAGVEEIILVTTARHMPRSVWVFESGGFRVMPAPCAYVAGRSPYDIRSYLPHWHVLAGSSDALHEYLGMLWYRLRYR